MIKIANFNFSVWSTMTNSQPPISVARFVPRCICILFFAVLAQDLLAQPATKPEQPAAKKEEEEDKTPEPERITLETKDGVILNCVYYGPKEGVREGKRTVPIIMIHGWGGRGSEFDFLARGLQTYGHASIVPDLRGHGRSTKQRIPGQDDKTLDPDRMNRDELNQIVLDIEAVKKFFMEKNNLGEVNIELLTVLAAEEGCIVALNWALLDWSWPQLPAYKQGQDVKALVLLSPKRQHKTMNANIATVNPIVGGKLSKLLVTGKNDRRAYSEAKRMYNTFEDLHPPDPKDPEKLREQKSLYFVEEDTNLQGTKLLDLSLPVNRKIAGFIQIRLVQKADEFPWSERKSPLSN